MAARAGDPAAFARFVEHWDPHVRRFVHLTLCDPDHTDQVMSATYVRAYRAMPTYRAEHRPGLWLQRIAYLTVADHLRRQERRGPKKPRTVESTPDDPNLPRMWTPEPDPTGRDLDRAAMGALRRLALDQRALVLLIDGSRFGLKQVAAAVETEPEMVRRRLAAARNALAATADHLPDSTTATLPDDDPARTTRAILAAVPVPPAEPRFWSDLGRRLLAEQERPAAPAIDPEARLARSHPSELGFRPRGSLNWSGAPSLPDTEPAARRLGATKQSLEPPRELEPEPRNWRTPLMWIGLVVVAAAIVVAAVVIGTSTRTPDGSITGRELAQNMSAAFTSSRYLAADAEVETLDAAGTPVTEPFRITIADDGSWAASATDRIDLRAHDADAGVARRVVVVTSDDAEPVVLASETTGLAAGGPDPVAQPIAALDDLRLIGSLMRGGPEDRAPASTVDEQRIWTFRRTVPTGVDGTDQSWRITVDRTDHLPRSIEVTQDSELVRRVTFTGWEPLSEVPDDTFDPALPEQANVDRTDHGFLPLDLAAVEILGRGPAITPAWLPEGFELVQVALRGDPPPAARSTAAGRNPPDVGVMSLGYQRGPERITVTLRAATEPAAWLDPFSVPSDREADPADAGEADHQHLQDLSPGRPASVTDHTVSDGRFNGTVVHGTVDGAGRARLWGTVDDLLLTVSGDLSSFEARQVIASMR